MYRYTVIGLVSLASVLAQEIYVDDALSGPTAGWTKVALSKDDWNI